MRNSKLHIISLFIFIWGNLAGQSTIEAVKYRGINHTPCEFISKTDSLIYRVNFQNIGTGSAENVAIIDTLDLNIDVTTLTTSNASHEYDFTLIQPNIAIWAFKNIYLPDSATDPVGSNGFVEFSVKPVSTIVAGTKVIDRAAILFDYNPPVITNSIEVFIESPPIAINAGNDDTVYYGYAPAANATLTASASGGVGNISYLWSTGETTASITVSPTSTTEYTVIASDEINCNAIDEVTVKVIDVHCGKNLNKVLICHYPPGNPANAQTICINAGDVPNHLSQHGDKLGACVSSAKMGANNEPGNFSEINEYNRTFEPEQSTDFILVDAGKNNLIIAVPSGIDGLSFELFDIIGRNQNINIIKNNESTFIADCEKLQKGLFVLLIKSDGKILSTKKVVVLR